MSYKDPKLKKRDRSYYFNVRRVKQLTIKLHIKELKLRLGCSKCGYNKCASALHFHHTDKNKAYRICNMWKSFKWERIQNEIQKCICLCANCHSELHEEERTSYNIYQSITGD